MASAATETQGRVFPSTGWAFGRDLSKRRLVKMIVASALVHAFLTPGPALLGLVAMLPALEVPDRSELVAIELTSLPLAAPATEPQRPTQEPASAEPSEPVKPEPESLEPREPAPEEPPAKDAPTEPDPLPPVAEPPREFVESTPFADPVALAGKAASIVDSNADIRLSIFADVIRDQPLGEKVGELLRRTPQWRDFFGPSQIDPIRDVDRVLLAGPDFRDSSEVVAVVQHRLPADRIDHAFDALVQRKGQWIDRDARLAKARADRAYRLFAAPNDSVVVVAPPQLEKQLRELGASTRFPETDGQIALSAYIVKPHYAAKGTGIVLPKSLAWARLDLRPSADGGGILHVLAQDKNEETAAQTAALVQALIEQATSVDLSRGGTLGGVARLLMGSSKIKMIKSVHFEADGDQIRGKLEATRNQLLNLADLVGALLPPAEDDRGSSGSLVERSNEVEGGPPSPGVSPETESMDSSNANPQDRSQPQLSPERNPSDSSTPGRSTNSPRPDPGPKEPSPGSQQGAE